MIKDRRIIYLHKRYALKNTPLHNKRLHLDVYDCRRNMSETAGGIEYTGAGARTLPGGKDQHASGK